MSDKIYVGGGKAIQTQYGTLLKLSFNKDDLDKLKANLNEKGWVNVNCNERKEVSQYGQTHSLVIDDWKKPEAKPNTPSQARNDAPSFDDMDESIPF